MKNGKNNKGFTLIEVVIYSGILAIFLTSSIIFVNALISSSKRSTANYELSVNREVVEERLTFLSEQAMSVTEPPKNTTDTKLTLDNPNVSYYPASFSVTDGKIIMSLSGKGSYPITNNRVSVDNFSVEHIESSQASSTLKINLTFASPFFNDLKTTSTLLYVISN